MPNWSEHGHILLVRTLTYIINDLSGEEIIGTFYEKELQKTNQKEFRIEKLLKQQKF